MTESDIFYRAFGELFRTVEKDAGISKIIDAAATAPKPVKLTVSHNVCNVEEDWLNAIERGLVFIGRAIEEDRQFIRSEGEVKPIEKVKNFSRESVQHLSRHSDLLTRKQEDDIVPEKLYSVQKESDYAVYENKFLYLLLCTVRKFVTVRYEAIKSAYKEYRGEYEAQKNVVTPHRRLDFEVKICDEQNDVVSAPADRRCASALERMEKILQSVSFYLRTPLMIEVARADKISGNITKTNVLMMNKNFNEALKLYEFILCYEGDGYSVEKTQETLDPVPEENMRELSVPFILLAFLVYEHGLKLEDYLKAEFEKEEERLREEEQKELVRRITELKKRIESSGEGIEEYILVLEERIKELEKNLPVLAAARAENSELKENISRLEDERKILLDDITELKSEIERLLGEMRRLEEEHVQELEKLRAEHEEETEKLKKEHEEELSKAKSEAEEAIADLKHRNEEEFAAFKRSLADEIARLKDSHAEEVSSIKNTYEQRLKAAEEDKNSQTARVKGELEAKLSEESARLNASISKSKLLEEEFAKLKEELDESEKVREVLEARLTAVRSEHGLLTEADDFTTEEGFNALEHEFEVLGRLVRDEWSDVKKILKKEFYSGLRDSARKKQPVKSREYEELSGKVRARKEKKTADGNGKKDGGSDGADAGSGK